ncbi:MAG: serine/threonine protein kinase [Bacteroidales bacterium]|nr:serine/threonine protein kinase [Bacteroidales bacterium]
MIQSSGFFYPVQPLPNDGTSANLEVLYESPEGDCILLKGHRNDRLVVYKALKKAFREDPVHQRMLRREYEIGASLKHPAICEVLSWTTLPEYGDSIEMEWIDGCTLDEWIILNPSHKGQLRRIFIQICEALSYMHQKRVFHKDLKPANILITKSGAYVKLIDFGLSDTESILTGKDPAGTWRYAAPEIIAGESADESCDIYSLGIIIKECSGRSFSRIARKCSAHDKFKRFASASDVKRALANGGRWWIWVLVVALILLVAGAAVLYYSNRENSVEQLFMDAAEQVREAANPSL